MPKLPPLSGREVVRALKRLGYFEVSQRGSHVKMRSGKVRCVVPLHRELKKGTLSGILSQTDLSIEQLVSAIAN